MINPIKVRQKCDCPFIRSAENVSDVDYSKQEKEDKADDATVYVAICPAKAQVKTAPCPCKEVV